MDTHCDSWGTAIFCRQRGWGNFLLFHCKEGWVCVHYMQPPIISHSPVQEQVGGTIGLGCWQLDRYFQKVKYLEEKAKEVKDAPIDVSVGP